MVQFVTFDVNSTKFGSAIKLFLLFQEIWRLLYKNVFPPGQVSAPVEVKRLQIVAV